MRCARKKSFSEVPAKVIGLTGSASSQGVAKCFTPVHCLHVNLKALALVSHCLLHRIGNLKAFAPIEKTQSTAEIP